MRNSKQRQLIMDIIKGRCDHPTAEMIYFSAREINSNISLGTVYRNLKLLADEGKILTLETEEKKLHYDGNTSRHSHFICSKCGRIIDLFKMALIPEELKELGVKINNEKCIYYGTCLECN